MHESGQWIESIYPLPMNCPTKERAAEITYGRRYLISSLLGVAADEDLDAAEDGATSKDKKPAGQPEEKKAVVPPKGKTIEVIQRPGYPTQEQLASMNALRIEAKLSESQMRDLIQAKYPGSKAKDLGISQFEDLMEQIGRMLPRKEGIPMETVDDMPFFDEGFHTKL